MTIKQSNEAKFPPNISQETLRRLFESAPMGILLVDQRGHIAYVNEEIERQFDYSRAELVSQYVEILLPERFDQIHGKHRANYMANPYFRSMGQGLDLTGRRKDGQEFPVGVSLNATTVDGDMMVIAFVEDETERKAAETKLARYAAELETQNEELDAFSHTVAHDLKTPVALLIGFAEILQTQVNDGLDEVVREALQQIVNTSLKLSNIINELLLLASVRRRDVVMEALDMFEVVENAQERMSFLEKSSGAEIILPYSWPRALGYGPWIEEVWANYISNAIKYGGKPPKIEIGSTGQADGKVRFWVRDNGPGVAPQLRPNLFRPFTQLAQVKAEGHGLGLSIVKRIVEKCHGEVGFESDMGAGSTFWFVLPMATE